RVAEQLCELGKLKAKPCPGIALSKLCQEPLVNTDVKLHRAFFGQALSVQRPALGAVLRAGAPNLNLFDPGRPRPQGGRIGDTQATEEVGVWVKALLSLAQDKLLEEVCVELLSKPLLETVLKPAQSSLATRVAAVLLQTSAHKIIEESLPLLRGETFQQFVEKGRPDCALEP